jgi:hypothetical protein
MNENYKNNLDNLKYEYDNKIEDIQDNYNYELNNLKDNYQYQLEEANIEFNENKQKLKDYYDEMIEARKIYEEMINDIQRNEQELNNKNNSYNNNSNNDDLPTYKEIINHKKTNKGNIKNYNDDNIKVIEFSENSEIKFEQKECLICIGEFEIGEKLAVLKCNHCYHDLCIKDWIKKVKGVFCPLCQASRN